MKFKAYVATYSSENSEITNKHNYFMNGLVKEGLSESNCADMCEFSRMRNMYALTDGSGSDVRGEDAAFLCVEMLREVGGKSFLRESEAYFESINDMVKGRAFETSGSNQAVDMAVVYIERNQATVYNMGDVSVFFSHGKSIKKISGVIPSTVEVEEVVNNGGEFKLKKILKDTVPYIGYLSDECEVVPYISDKIKLKKDDYIILASKEVSELISEKEISEILYNNKIPDKEKAIEIINLAYEKRKDGNYTVEVICASGNSMLNRISKILLAVLTALIVGFTVYLLGAHIVSAGDAIKNGFVFIAEFLTGGSEKDKIEVETVEPWVPIVADEDLSAGQTVDQTEEEQEINEEQGVREAQVQTSNQNSNKAQPKSVNKPVVTTKQTTEESAVKNEEQTSLLQENTPEPETPAPPIVDSNEVELPIDFD